MRCSTTTTAPGESIVLLRPGDPPTSRCRRRRSAICDLRDIVDGGGNVVGWNHEDGVPAGTIGIDPERGRVLLGAPAPTARCSPRFHYGSARAIGGGEYERTPDGADLADAASRRRAASRCSRELDAIAAGGRLLIGDSLTYAQTPDLQGRRRHRAGAPGSSVVVAARNRARPLIAAGGDDHARRSARAARSCSTGS